jgi:phosphohistidine phosphatase
MQRLILFRHGKAEPDSLSGDDFDRRLAPRGVLESAAMGASLDDLGFRPDVVLVSTSARTRDTWEAMARTFANADVRFEADLYHADSGALRQAGRQAGKTANTVMIVAHNPGLQELTIQLLMEGSAPADLINQAQRKFPPAATSVFLFDANGRPSFDGLFYPDPPR